MITGITFIDLPLLIIIIIGIIKLVCAYTNKIWEIRHYIDKFNRPTKECYVSQIKKRLGTFSNSATSNSIMSYITFLEKDGVSFKFWDYERYPLNNTYSEPIDFDFHCIASSGKTLSATAVMYGETSQVMLDDEYVVDEFIELLQTNKSLRIIISSGLSEYRFTLKRGNFNKVFKSLPKNK